MKSMKNLLNASIPDDELSVNLQKTVKMIKLRNIGKIAATLIASLLVPLNVLYAIFFTFYHTDSAFVEGVHTAFAAELSVALNNFLADFFTSFALRCVALTFVICILVPMLVSGLVMLLFYVLSNSIIDKDINPSSKSIRDGFKAVNESFYDNGYEMLLTVGGFVLSALIGLVFEIFLFKNEILSNGGIMNNLGIILSSILLLGIFVILCKIFCIIATIPVKSIKVNAGISKYDFDKLWVQKDPIEKKEREEAVKRLMEAEERKREQERKYRATHAKIKVHFRCSRSDYRAIIKDNGTFLFDLKPGQTKTADVPVGEHYITSQVVDDYEGGRGNVNGGSVYLGPGEIQELEVTA